MKWKWMCIVWVTCVAAMAQEEVPPAFEQAGAKIDEAEEEDLFDPALNAPKSVRVQVEFIEMPHKTATKLLMEDKSKTTDATPLRMKLQGLVDKDEAKVLETQLVIAKSNQKATTESHQEFLYPEEYSAPSGIPSGIADSPPASGNPAQIQQSLHSISQMTSFNPESFTARHLGSTLEAEPVIAGHDDVIDLRFVPEITWHTGDRVWNDLKDMLGNLYQVKMPDFYSIRLNTSISCISGQYFLVGMLSPKNEKGDMNYDRKVMLFVKCDILVSVP